MKIIIKYKKEKNKENKWAKIIIKFNKKENKKSQRKEETNN